MSLFSDFEVQRVRNNILPVGPVYYPVNGMWYEGEAPSYRRPYWCPVVPWDSHGKFLNEQTLRGADIAFTGDVPRKYKDKIALSFPGNRTIKLWKFLPFYKLNYRKRVDSKSPTVQGGPLRCEPPTMGYKACYATSNNEWLSRYPHDFPLRDECAYNPYVGTWPDSPTSGSTSEFFEWCESLNLTYLVKRGLDALESALTNFPDMLVVFGELGEVADLFKRPDSVGDAYLQNQFGISPTIGSIEDVAVGVSHRWNDAFGPKRLIVHQRQKGEVKQIDGQVHTRDACCWGSDEKCPLGCRSQSTDTDESVVTLELVYSYDPPDWGSAVLNKLDQFLTRMNMVGDASTLWELVRMSWMVDWFIPVGTILKGVSARAGTGKFSQLHVYMGYVSFRRVRTRKNFSNMYECQYGSTCLTCETDEYVRIPLRNPWSWLDLAMDMSSAPHTLSQLLTVAALASK